MTLRKLIYMHMLRFVQDIPTSFWRCIGPECFSGIWYTLKGPLSPGCVKSANCVTRKQTFCFLTTGWAEFLERNNFGLGDTLKFTKIGRLEFEVRIT